MSDITVGLLVDRSSLGLDDLELNDGVNYVVTRDGISGLYSRTFRKVTADSPFVAGRVVTALARDVVPMTYRVRIKADSDNALNIKMFAMLDAFSQGRYAVTIT